MNAKDLERTIELLIHQNTMVVNKGSENKPDYVVGGVNDLKREFIKLVEAYHKHKIEEWKKGFKDFNEIVKGMSEDELQKIVDEIDNQEKVGPLAKDFLKDNQHK